MTGTRQPTERINEIDHTGDRGLEISAGSLARVFELAATGMFGLLIAPSTVGQVVSRTIELSAPDLPTLLREWLSELNYIHLTEGLVFGQFDVRQVSGTSVTATAVGEPIDPKRHKILTEIKAVTYHDMVIEDRNGVWYARIIFDI